MQGIGQKGIAGLPAGQPTGQYIGRSGGRKAIMITALMQNLGVHSDASYWPIFRGTGVCRSLDIQAAPGDM
jgi:hypothetical protein